MNKQPVIAVVGPTASGKSDLAVSIAQTFNGEVISADSRQVYTGMDIGTGKITEEEMCSIPHHLLDIANPQTVYTAPDFKRDATQAIDDIASRDKLPILCGGTGYYLDALLYDRQFPKVPPNEKLRKDLANTETSLLYQKLTELDPDRALTIDKHNPHRLIRALEVATALGKVPSLDTNSFTSPYSLCLIGIMTTPEELSERITSRLHARIESGMIEEVTNLHSTGTSWDRMISLGLEYRYIAYYLTGSMTKDEAFTKLATQIRRYAKRQMTWLKRNPHIHWIDRTDIDTAETLIQQHLQL